MKLTNEILRKLIKEEMSNVNAFEKGSSPYDNSEVSREGELGPKKDENGNLIYYRDSKTGVLWPSPQSPEDEKVIMAPIA